MFALIRTSIRNGGSGVIIAITMPSTPMGTTNSRQLAMKPVCGVTTGGLAAALARSFLTGARAAAT